MKVLNLPDSYLQDQLCIKIQNFLTRQTTEFKDRVVILPRSLSVITKMMVENPSVDEATLLKVIGLKQPLS